MAHNSILAFNAAQNEDDRRICASLMEIINHQLPEAERKIWHAHPVWFLAGNPVVGYSKIKDCVRLMFWSGQSFKTTGLAPSGSFRAAERRYTSNDEIDLTELQSWLEEAKTVQWDYKNIQKRKGKLKRLV